MKLKLLAGAFLAAALLLCCPGATGLQHSGGNGVFHDLGSFRLARLMLPEKHDSFCTVAAWDEIQGDDPPVSQYRLSQSCQFDLDGDGLAEKYTLRDGLLTVEAGSRMIWQSPRDWWVDYFFLGDANNDGTPELNLLVWKEGSFGAQKPFWLEEEVDTGVKNHLFSFKLEEGNLKPMWHSSNLDRPNYRAALIDLNGDGENELVALEGCYNDPGKQKITVWKWNGWGFSRIDLDHCSFRARLDMEASCHSGPLANEEEK